MCRRIFFSMVLVFSSSVWANEYSYQADVKGMVCAFCAYNVSKNISTIPGVDAGSVDVDLHGGQVKFNSSQIVNENKLNSVFTDSGFTLSNLQMSEAGISNIHHKGARPLLKLEFNSTEAAMFNAVVEAIGDIVANTSSQLLIMAPPADEDKLLKPLLMGRQQVINIRYVAEESESIRIQLFTEQ